MAGPSVRLPVGAREVNAFRLCGLIGFIAACAVALSVSAATGLSLATEATLIAVAVVVFLSLALFTKAVTGREQLIYYHHEVAVLACVAGASALLGAPVLAHLDATVLGLAAFLACGRVGCLLVGCCHGRPARHGISYGEQHATEGFPEYLVGVRLIPVQALEAVVAVVLLIAGLIAVLGQPGEAFGIYVTGYAVARFGLEELRGDTLRRYWHGLSEAQWTSLAVASAMTAMAALRWLPGLAAHAAATAVLAFAAVIVACKPMGGLLHPRHVGELAHVFPVAREGQPAVATTSLGLRVSAGLTEGASHYTFTRSGRALDEEEAMHLARVVAWLRGGRQSAQVVRGASAFHVLFPASESSPAPTTAAAAASTAAAPNAQ
jgi:prolipoprotein diacylglyceryltransferase